MKRLLILLLLFLSLVKNVDAGAYAEHKDIGEIAFNRFIQKLSQMQYFKDSSEIYTFFKNMLNLEYEPIQKGFIFKNLTFPPNYVTYGVLCGLAGDHEKDPVSLAQKLEYKYSEMHRIINLHNRYISSFEYSAGDVELLGLDFKYLSIGLLDYSHFYNYGRSLSEHIEDLDLQFLNLLKEPRNIPDVFEKLEQTNPVTKYICLHSFALYLMELAAKYFSSSPETSKIYLYYAIFYNAFADHYLQDCFASGHMVVNRSLFGGIINNKALHDFYNIFGFDVVNLHGNSWKTCGDNRYNKRTDEWKDYTSYDKIGVSKNSIQFDLVTEATSTSLLELYIHFFKRISDNNVSILQNINVNKNNLENFFIDNYIALTYIPLPFNSDLKKYNFDKDRLPEFQKINMLIKNRDFIRTRVANSVAFILGPYESRMGKDSVYWNNGIRINISGSSYSYSDLADKTGCVDRWFGYTTAFLIGHDQFKKFIHAEIKSGIMLNNDFWLSSSKYLGVQSYLEVGLHMQKNISKLFFSASIGIQLGPLLGLEIGKIPEWLRIPLYLLPMKFVGSANFFPSYYWRPQYHAIWECDLVF